MSWEGFLWPLLGERVCVDLVLFLFTKKNLQNLPRKPSGPEFFFMGRFLITHVISLLVIDLFRIFISSLVSSGY